MKAIRVNSYGGPEVLKLVEVEEPRPKPGEVLVRNRAIGVNFLETRQRRGDYPLKLPGGIGVEGAGRVEALGEGVTAFRPGDRVGYMGVTEGSYAEATVVRADRAFPLPETVSFERAAASTIKGMTARALLKRTYPVGPGTTALVWAAAGGMGQHLVRWASRLGGRVIAVVGSVAKVDIPHALGAEHVLLGTSGDIPTRIRELTGEGVDVVYDAIGHDTATASLDSLAPLGTFVNYGSASGHPPDLRVTDLSDRGSLFYTRAVLYTYIRTPALFRETAEDVVDALRTGLLDLPPPRVFPLAEAAAAHEALASRATTGSLVLVP